MPQQFQNYKTDNAGYEWRGKPAQHDVFYDTQIKDLSAPDKADAADRTDNRMACRDRYAENRV